MRQIKFKGKCQRGYDYSDGDGWIYGSLLQKDKVCAIVKTEDIDLSPKTDDGYSFVEDFGCVPVIPDTVSQFTGLLDIDRTELYEYDIITTEISLMIVVWVQITASFGAMPIKHYKELTDKKNIPTNNIYWFDNDIVNFGIYGNVFDNPELLNEKQ